MKRRSPWFHPFGSAAIGTALLLIASVGSALAQAEAGARPKEVIAVLDLRAVGESEALASAVSDRLREELLKTGYFKMVDRSRLAAVLEEQALQSQTCAGESCAIEVGRIVGAPIILTGSLTKLEAGTWQVSVLMLDVETSETLRAESVLHEGRIVGLIGEAIPALARKLAPGEDPLARFDSILAYFRSTLESFLPAEEPVAEPPPPEAEPEPSRVTPFNEEGALRLSGSPLSVFSLAITLKTDSGDRDETFSGSGYTLGLDYFFTDKFSFGAAVYDGVIREVETESTIQKNKRVELENVDGTYQVYTVRWRGTLAFGRYLLAFGIGVYRGAVEFEGFNPQTGEQVDSDVTIGGLLGNIEYDFTFSNGFFLGAGAELGLGTVGGKQVRGTKEADGGYILLYFPLGFSF